MNKLLIKTALGDYSFEVNYNKGDDLILPWREFYQWYMNELESDRYVFEYDTGLLYLERDLVRGFVVEVVKR